MAKAPTCLRCGAEHFSTQPCPSDKSKAVTKSRSRVTSKRDTVTKPRPAPQSAAPVVTKSREAELRAMLFEINERLAAVEAWIAEKDKKALSQAERAKRYRDRKKAERAQERGE